MNLFKKALVASAIVASFGASAATVSSTALTLSSEGVAAGNTENDINLVFDVVVDTLHPAASTITLTFDSTIDLDGIVGGSVVNTPANGTGTVGDVSFDYGTGSFTFDNVVIDDNDQAKGEKDTISFDINLGNPLTANSAFRIYIGDGSALALGGGVDKVDIGGAASVAYSSVTSADAAIETGTGVIATTASQFAFSVTTALDAIINRVDNTTYAPAGTADSLVLSATNNEALLANITAPTFTATLSGDFTGVVANGAGLPADEVLVTTATAATPLAAVELAVINVAEDEIVVPFANANITTSATASVITLAFDHAGTAIPTTGDVTVDWDIASADLTTALNFVVGADAGEWALDATVINVPYFPVGYTGTSSSIHFANEDASTADVIVSAIDGAGNVYTAVDLGKDLAGNTVTKVSQTELMTLFGLVAPTKLSVTFNIDADDGDVNAHAFTSSSAGRTEIATSQER